MPTNIYSFVFLSPARDLFIISLSGAVSNFFLFFFPPPRFASVFGYADCMCAERPRECIFSENNLFSFAAFRNFRARYIVDKRAAPCSPVNYFHFLLRRASSVRRRLPFDQVHASLLRFGERVICAQASISPNETINDDPMSTHYA